MLLKLLLSLLTVIWSFCSYGDKAPSVRAKLVDPKILEKPLRKNDPLEILKRLWTMGARGPLVRVTGSDPDHENGYFLAVDDWSSVHIQRGAGAVFLNDAELLEYIKVLHNTGIEFIVHNRIPSGAFALPVNSLFHKLLRPLVPKLKAQPYLAINGFTHIYLLVHELVHHSDHVSEKAYLMWDEIYRETEEFNLTRAERNAIYMYTLEAPAYLAEIAALKNSRTVIEWKMADDSSWERGDIFPFEGQQYRRERLAFVESHFNETYFAKFDRLPTAVKIRVDKIISAYIPNRLEQFGLSNELRVDRVACAALLSSPVME